MHIVIGLLIAFVIVSLYVLRNRATRNCRWRADASGDQGSSRKYRCAACGAVTYTDKPGPPRICKLHDP